MAMAPDLYEAMGGQLTSLNEQLAGFQQELSGMKGQVPEPSIVPPNVTSPMGQVGSVLADMFSPMAGIKNPITEKQEAYRAQQMEGVKERRSILQQQFNINKGQADLVNASLDIERQRQAQEDAVLRFIPTLLADDSPPEAKLMGKTLLQSALGKRGFTGDLGNFTGKPFNKDDVNDVLISKERGLPEDVVRAAHPRMPEGMFRLVWDQPKLADEMLPGLIPGYKTIAERTRAAEKHAMEMRESLQKQHKEGILAMMPGGGATADDDLVVMDAEHMRRNGGRHFWEGNQASQDRAIADWREWKTAKDDPMAKVGLAGLLQQSRQNHNRHKVDMGKGRWYDAVTDTYRVDIDGLELSSGRFKSISEKDWANVEFMKRATVMADKLRNLIPKVLSDTPVDNIRQMLANTKNQYTGADPNLNEFFRLVYLIPMEEVRAVGGSTNVRQGLYQILQKHASVRPYDTQRTAKQVVDSLKVDFYNLQATIHDMPQLLPGQRIGPGRFLAYPIDPVTGAPILKDATGRDLGQITKPLPAGKVSPKEWYIMETVD